MARNQESSSGPGGRGAGRSLAAAGVYAGVVGFMLAAGGLLFTLMVWSSRPPSVASELLREAGSIEQLTSSPAFVKGKEHFINSCTACHTEDGGARAGLGIDIVGSRFVQRQRDEELAAFIRRGRTPTDPLNQTGVDMPPRGGNPALQDEQIREIVVYIRGLEAMAEAERHQ